MSKEDIAITLAKTVVINAETNYIAQHMANYDRLIKDDPVGAGKELDKVLDEKIRTKPDRYPDEEEAILKRLGGKKK